MGGNSSKVSKYGHLTEEQGGVSGGVSGQSQSNGGINSDNHSEIDLSDNSDEGETHNVIIRRRGSSRSNHSGIVSFNKLTTSVSKSSKKGRIFAHEKSLSSEQSDNSPRTLNTLFGVFMPCVLAMFSLVLFLRVGVAVGQCGIYMSLVILGLGYTLIIMTTLSICAISTNGEVQAGGAYFMISRTLGPEFGGALGVLLFVSNVLSSGTYIISMTEALVDSFGENSGSLVKFLPETYSYELLYCTIILFTCLAICGFSGSLYAKSVFLIFIIVNSVLVCVIINFFIADKGEIDLPTDSVNFFNQSTASFTGLSLDTFEQNSKVHYSEDYTTGDQYTFISVFAIVFNGCTGILSGANLSGELKDPAKSIPKGTLLAEAYTFFIYAFVYFMVAFTCSPDLLQMNYTFLQPINFCPELVFVGTILVTMSAALSAFIGASRILYAIAKDEVLGVVSRPFAQFASRKGNPYLSVLFTAALIQLVLLIGNVNMLAPMVSIFFLMVYFFINVACALLDIASAPNFRPSFKYFSWHISLLGMLGCLTMIFLISPLYAAVNLLILVVLIVLISIIGPTTGWGAISQGLNFYFVRKFLLKLDPMKEHVKFWRPQILLLVNNPKTCVPLMCFTNDLKKSGLYVIGHVLQDNWDSLETDPVPGKLKHWHSLIDYLELKAFVEMNISTSIRLGALNLARLSGLGGMKPNTVIMGFYDSIIPVDTLGESTNRGRSTTSRMSYRAKMLSTTAKNKRRAQFENMTDGLSPIRDSHYDRCFDLVEYITLIDDIIAMNKNVCIARNFNSLDFRKLHNNSGGNELFIDVWLLDFLNPSSYFITDIASLFLLQLACVLKMKGIWKSNAMLRVWVPHRENNHQVIAKVKDLLGQLRISAVVENFDSGRLSLDYFSYKKISFEDSLTNMGNDEVPAVENSHQVLPLSYFEDFNEVIRLHSSKTIVSFLYLPKPPINNLRLAAANATRTPNQLVSSSNENETDLFNVCEKYLEQLELLTKHIPPSLLVHGVSTVTCTSF